MQANLLDGSVDVGTVLGTAIHAERISGLLHGAGAPAVRESAVQTMVQVASSQVARWLVEHEQGLQAPPARPDLDDNLLASARGIIDEPAIHEVVDMLAFARRDHLVQVIREALAEELAAIADRSARFAVSERRPVCYSCIVVGAARAAADIFPFRAVRAPWPVSVE